MSIFTKKSKANQKTTAKVPNQILQDNQNKELNGNLEETLNFAKMVLGESDDFKVRQFHVFGQYPAAIMYFSNVVDQKVLNEEILKPLMDVPRHLQGKQIEPDKLSEILVAEALYHGESQLEKNMVKLIEAVSRGETLIVVQGMSEGIHVGTRNVDKRSINSPETEKVIRGAREGFIESLGSNIALLRYRLQTPNLRVKSINIGRQTKTKVAVVYLDGVANPALVAETMDRLSAVDIDGIIDVGYIEQFIEDHNMSPFPQIQNTERPDKTVAMLLEGRVAILADGSPFALIVPAVFTQFYQTLDDYTERWLMGSLVRVIRIVALLFSLFFPSLYVAVISFNPEMIPTDFAVATAGGRAGVPFPSVVEVFIMEISMEVLREATLRMPQQVGGALSIVGVLVIGQAAVAAGFVSPITVVIIALTTIGSFATPAYNAAISLRMLRFPMLILAGMFGLYGVMMGFIMIMNHILSLKSFGVPYLSPVVPSYTQGLKGAFIRAPFWWMPRRPAMLHPPNEDRLGEEVQEIKQPPSNTLDPLKVGNERWDDSNGVSSRDNRGPSDGNSQ